MPALVSLTTSFALIAVVLATVVSFATIRYCRTTRPYRIMIALGWLYFTLLYIAATVGDFYLVRSGILTRFGIIMLALVFILESVIRIRGGGEC